MRKHGSSGWSIRRRQPVSRFVRRCPSQQSCLVREPLLLAQQIFIKYTTWIKSYMTSPITQHWSCPEDLGFNILVSWEETQITRLCRLSILNNICYFSIKYLHLPRPGMNQLSSTERERVSNPTYTRQNCLPCIQFMISLHSIVSMVTRHIAVCYENYAFRHGRLFHSELWNDCSSGLYGNQICNGVMKSLM